MNNIVRDFDMYLQSDASKFKFLAT